MKRSEIFFSTLLVPVDFAMLFLAFISSYYLRNQYGFLSPDNLLGYAEELRYHPVDLTLTFSQYLHYLSVIVPGMVIIFALIGLYAMRSNLSWFQRALRVLLGVSIGEGFVLLLFLLKKDFFIPRSTVLYSWILGTLFVILGRLLIRAIQKYLQRFNIGVIRTAIIGKSATANKVITRLSSQSGTSYRIVAHIESREIKEVLSELRGIGLDELIVVNERYTDEDLIAVRNYCVEQSISFSFVPSLLTELPSIFHIRMAAGLPMIEVRPTPLDGWGRVVKRIFDLFFGTVLLVLFSPFILVISIFLKVSSPGPLFYRHKRIGKDGHPLCVIKFRSMKWEYCTGINTDGDKAFKELLDSNPDLKKEWQEHHKLKDDPRISGIGRFLRKTSLDELPQFFNVLSGTLSLVGPRPIVDDEVKKYGERARLLFSIKPGITGLWQVSGRANTSYSERVLLDVYYIEHWNIWSDLVILIKTGVGMFSRNGGAY